MSYKSLFLIIVFLLIPIVFLSQIQKKGKSVLAEWFDDNWRYRQSINISSHTASESDVYISASIDIGSTDKSQTDGGDFRFITNTGQLLDYYIVSGASTTTYSFHIQIPSFPSGPQTIYAYYGNPSAVNGFSTSDFSTEATNYTIGSYSAEETGGGPIAWWKFDEGTGTTLFDSSTSQYHATLGPGNSSPSWVDNSQCVSGKCLLFDGSNDLVSLNSQISTINTISFWIKPTTDTSFIINFDNGSHYISGSGGTIAATGFSSPSIYINGATDNTLPTNSWSHITVTTETPFVGSSISIGKVSSSFYKGYLDEIKIFPYARTATQIKADYGSGLSGQSNSENSSVNFGSSSNKSLSDGLIGYWKFDEGIGTTSIDSSGNSKTITLGSTTPSWGIGKYGTGLIFSDSQFASIGSTISSIYSLSLWYYSTTTAPTFLQFDTTTNIGASASTIYTNNITSPTIYVDGIQTSNIGTTNTWHLLTITTSSPITGNQIILGQSSSLDELRFYSKVLSIDEIRQIYNYLPGPVGYWKFEEGVGTTAYDSSGNSKNGKIWNGGSFGPGKFGKAIALNIGDSTNQYITFSQINHNFAFTKEAWVYPTSYACASSRCSIIGPYFELVNPGTFYYYDYQLSSPGWHTMATNIPLNRWTHIALSYDNSTLKAFVNGIQTYTVSVGNSGAHISDTIGAYNSGIRNFRGYIDEVKIYNYARTPAQIIGDMNGSSSQNNQTLAHYKFDEGFGSTVNNSSSIGSTLNGSLGAGTSAPSWTVGKNNKALSFDGSDDIVNISDNDVFNLDKNFSVSGWFKTSATGTRTGIFYLPTGGYISLFVHSTNTFYFESRDSNNAYLGTNAGSYHDGQWHHFVATRDDNNDKLSIYLDGLLISSVGDTRIGTFNSTSGPIIGQDSSGYKFNGLIDEVKIYNYALTADEVKADYNLNSSAQIGQSFQTIGSTTTSLDYCIPGDTSTCLPPIAEWKLDEGVGTTNFDTGTGGYHLSLASGTSAPTWSSGKIGKSLSFSGSQYSYISSGLGALNTLTVSLWFKTGTTDVTIFGQSDQIPPTAASAFVPTLAILPDGHLRAEYWTGSLAGTTTPFIVNDNQWHHVALTSSGTSQSLYFDNTLIGTRSGTTNNSWWTKTTIGTGYMSSNRGGSQTRWNYFTGQIDQVRVYNYARTPAQIAYDYNKGAPIAHWKFDECQGTTAFDSSGLGNTGTIYSAGNIGTCTTGVSGDMWYDGVSGKNNSSLDFDNTTSDYVQIENNSTLQITDEISVCAWVKTSNTSLNGGIFEKTVGGTVNTSYLLFAEGANYKWRGKDTSGTQTLSSITTLTNLQNQWAHVCGTFSKSNSGLANIYINGKLDNTSNFRQTSLSTGSGVSYIGKLGSDVYPFSGQIDDVRVYNYALTSTQVTQIYNNGVINFR